MRWGFPVFLTVLVAAASAQAGGNYAGECRRMTRQIAHFEDVVDMAQDRGDALWEQGTQQHIARLSERRVRLCPEYARTDTAAESWKATKKLIKVAARAAAKYFTFGMY